MNDKLQDIDIEYEELRLENIKLRYATRSFVDAYERAMRDGTELQFTRREVDRIKQVQEIL